jgi:hypothetical protein
MTSAVPTGRDSSIKRRDSFWWRRLNFYCIFLGGAIASLMIAHQPMLFSGLRLVQGDHGDTRFNNYVLEHEYLWCRSVPVHRLFWDPPFFHPARNVLAYSDVLTSFLPVYGFWRILGAEADTAFQLWMLSACVLNYALCFLLFSAGLRASTAAAAFGAAFFASAACRTAQLGHQQLYPHWYLLLLLFCLFRLAALNDSAGSRDQLKRRGLCLLSGICLAMQFWGGFYNGFFAVLMGCAAVFAGMLFPRSRARLVSIGRRNWLALTMSVALCGLLILPLAHHYLLVVSQTGQRPFDEVLSMCPRPLSWIFPGIFAVFYSWMNPIVARQMNFGYEQGLGLGFLSSAAVLLGFWFGRRRAFVPHVLVLTAFFISVSTVYADRYTAWYLVYKFVPCAGAVRAVSRIGLMMTYPGALGIVLLIDSIRGKARILAFIAATVCLVEQFSVLPSYNKEQARQTVAEIAAKIPSGAPSFFYSRAAKPDDPEQASAFSQLDAMWASIRANVPTVNGYSGNVPSGYELWENIFDTEKGRDELRDGLGHWKSANGLGDADVTWIGSNDIIPSGPAPRSQERLCALIAFDKQIDADGDESSKYLTFGWSPPAKRRWNDGKSARICFSIPQGGLMTFRMFASPFLVPGKLEAQEIDVEFNDVPIQRLYLRDYDMREYSIALPGNLLRTNNVIQFQFPDAAVPADLGVNSDRRSLALDLKWFELDLNESRP